MAKSKNPSGEQPPQPKDENLNGEIDRRLTALEKSTTDLNNRIFDSHKWFVTVLFSAVAVVLTVYGVMSRLDVKDSTAAMEKRVDAKTSEMEKKVQAFVGETKSEHIKAGMRKAVKRTYVPSGRPKKVFDRERVHALHAEGKSIRAIAAELKVGRGTVERLLRVPKGS